MKTIRLTRADTVAPADVPHSWPIKVTALGLEGAPSAIFVFSKAKAGDPLGDVFQCVASAAQLEELSSTPPAPNPGDEVQTPFYLSPEATFVCRTPEDAKKVWEYIQADVLLLLQNINSADALEVVSSVDVSADGIVAT